MQNKERHRLAREREAAFLLAFYRKDSPTRLDRRASAIAAGYPISRAVWCANRVLDKYAEAPFRDCAEIVGINKAQLAVMLAEFMESAVGKEKLASIRLMMEATDSVGSPKGAIASLPILVISGATPERMARLRGGSKPLPSALEHDVIDVEAAISALVEAPKQPR